MLLYSIIRIDAQILSDEIFHTQYSLRKENSVKRGKGLIIKFARSVKVGVIGNTGNPFHRSKNNETLPETHGRGTNKKIR